MDAIGNKKRLIKTFVTTFAIVAMIALMATTAVVALSADGTNELPAVEAATEIKQSTISTWLNASSGDYKLTEDVTLTSQISDKTFSGTFDGDGHTITLSGSVDQSYGTDSSQTDHNVGALFGVINGGTIKNVKIKFTGNYVLTAKNSNKGQESASTTLYAGIVCALAKNNAKFENVELEITGNFAVIGLDGASGTQNNKNFDSYASGQGAVVGGLIGRSEGATIKNIVLNNSGSILAHAENKDAGKTYKGDSVNCSSPARKDRANAGGLIGETANAQTTVTSLTLSGNGVVGAYTSGLANGSDQSRSHNINAAGLVLGAGHDTNGVLNISGLWFKATGKAYVAQLTADSKLRAGVLIGRTNAQHIISNLWRNVADGKTAARGQQTVSSTDSAPAISTISVSDTVGTNFNAVAVGEGDVATTSFHAYDPGNYVTLNGVANKYGTATIVGLKDGKLDIEVSCNDTYWISALSYKKNSTFGNYTNIYKEMLVHAYTFTAGADVSCDEFRASVATESYDMSTDFSGGATLNSNGEWEKTYDNSGITFNGSPVLGTALREDLRWVITHDYEQNDVEQENTYGTYGNNTITTGRNVGKYTIALYKKGTNGEDVQVPDGEVIASDFENGPSILYRYKNATYTCRINRASLNFTAGSAVLTKVYDGTTNIGALIRGEHYYLKDLNGNDPITEPKYSFASGSYNDANAGDSKTVNIKGFVVTGNYQLSGGGTQDFTLSGQITKRVIGVDWTNTELIYNGTAQKPTATPNNLLEADKNNLSVTVNTYLSEKAYDYGRGTPCDTINVGNYFAFATLSGNADTNYRIETNMSVISVNYTIVSKAIKLDWTEFKDTTFSNSGKTVTVALSYGSACGEDVIKISLAYEQNGTQLKENAIWHAGNGYDAVATIDNSNYVIESGYERYSRYSNEDGTYGTITINPWEIELKYYTGTLSKVEDLTYAGKNYIGDDDGLHVGIVTENTALDNANFTLRYFNENGDGVFDVTNVGTYTAKVSLVESGAAVLSDYVIAETSKSQVLTVVAKEVTIAFDGAESNKITYTYDGTAKEFSATITEGRFGTDQISISYHIYADETGETEITMGDAINAGTYYIEAIVDQALNYTGSIKGQLKINAFGLSDDVVTVSEIENFGYNGSERTPTPNVYVKLTGKDRRLLSNGTDYELKYKNNVDVATADSDNAPIVTITGKGNYSGSVSKTFTIEPGTLEVKYIGAGGKFIYNSTNKYSGITYDDSHTSGLLVEFTGVVEGESAPEYTIKYRSTSSTDYSETAPTGAGEYEAVVELVGAVVNYKLPDPVPTATFDILPKSIQIEFSIPGSKSELVYNANEQGVAVTFKNSNDIYECDKKLLSIALSYESINGGMYNALTGGPKDAGTYRAIATLMYNNAISQNYVIENGQSAYEQTPYNFTIEQKEVEVEYDDTETTYNRQPQYIKCNWTKDALEGSDDVPINVAYLLNMMSADTPINAGTYNVTVSSSSNNYKIVNNTCDFNIKKQELTISNFYMLDDSTYYYNGSEIVLSYDLQGLVDGDDVNLDHIFTDYTNNINGELVSYCKDAGSYSVKLALPEMKDKDDPVQNYTLNLSEIDGKPITDDNFGFTILPRKLVIEFENVGTMTYSAEDVTVVAKVYAKFNGRLNNDGNGEMSGIVKEESVDISVEVIDENGHSAVPRNVGIYYATASLSSRNYELDEDGGGENGEHLLTQKLTITQMPISFAPKVGVTKTYGDSDASCDFTQIIDGLGSEKITVVLERDRRDQENCENVVLIIDNNGGYTYGGYDYVGFSISTEDQPYAANYSVTMNKNAGGIFTIVKRVVEFEPNLFTIDYQDDVPELTQIVPVNTSVFGIDEVTLTFERDNTDESVGTYDLKTEFKQSNANYTFEMVEGSNIGKFVILGKAVKVELDSLKLQKTFGESDPNLYDAIVSVEVEKASSWLKTDYKTYVDRYGSAEGFDWSTYLTLEIKDKDVRGDDYEHYREQGYEITFTFKNINTNDNSTYPDGNFRAVFVDSEGKECEYVFMINKKVLAYEDIKPEVSIEKTYDGDSKTIVSVDNDIYDKYYAAASINAVANYESAEAGTNKKIYVNFEILDKYVNDYVLPQNVLYTDAGIINPKKLTVTATPTEDINLVYGQTPSVKISYSGFILSQTVETEGIEVVAKYTNGDSLDVIRNVSKYEIKLYVVKCDSHNYVIEQEEGTNACKGTSISVNISQRALKVVPSGEVFVKPVDGNDTANIGPEHYVLEGLLSKDKGTGMVDIEIYSQKLTSKGVGNSTVNVVIEKLTGSSAGNYALENDRFSVVAKIKNLAIVTMTDAAYDYDGTEKELSPELSDVQDGVIYYLKYRGRDGNYGGDNGITEPPTNAGKYDVVCYVSLLAEDGVHEKYTLEMAKAQLTINKIAPTISFEGLLTQVYGSFTPVTATATSNAGLNEALNVSYSFMDDDGTMPAFPPAGEHTISAKYEETTNYTRVSVTERFTIKQREIQVRISDYTGLVYNGYDRRSDIKVEFVGVVEGDTCKPIKNFSSTFVKNAGSYTLVVTPENVSYKITGKTSVQFTIAKKTLYVVAEETTAELGTKPEFTLNYSGFVENEDVDDLDVVPSVKLSANQVGVNAVQYNKGSDDNYEFVYLDSTYTITYTAVNDGKDNLTPYIIALCIIGGIGIIVALALITRSITLRTVYNAGYSRKAIRKDVFGKNKNKKSK